MLATCKGPVYQEICKISFREKSSVCALLLNSTRKTNMVCLRRFTHIDVLCYGQELRFARGPREQRFGTSKSRGRASISAYSGRGQASTSQAECKKLKFPMFSLFLATPKRTLCNDLMQKM